MVILLTDLNQDLRFVNSLDEVQNCLREYVIKAYQERLIHDSIRFDEDDPFLMWYRTTDQPGNDQKIGPELVDEEVGAMIDQEKAGPDTDVILVLSDPDHYMGYVLSEERAYEVLSRDHREDGLEVQVEEAVEWCGPPGYPWHGEFIIVRVKDIDEGTIQEYEYNLERPSRLDSDMGR